MSKKVTVRLFTSESVCAGHPDKIADAISDAVVDAVLEADPEAHTGIETVAGANQIALYAQIKTDAKVDYEKIVRQKIKELGYTNPAWGFSPESTFIDNLHQQSPEIAIGADDDGAGDQGMMFGYACKETPELMPHDVLCLRSTTGRSNESVNRRSSESSVSTLIKFAGISMTNCTSSAAEDACSAAIPKMERLVYRRQRCLRS